ncbi:MAG: hypothetical protein ACK533_00665, partial [Planctomycetota bacterium]
MRSLCVLVLAPLLSGCATWFFSGEDRIDRSRPVALVETTGGVEYGATTEFGVLPLGRTATSGPCRVHYFLGPTRVIESGTLDAAGGMHVAAMGPWIDDGQWAAGAIETLVLRPCAPSQTAA